MMNADNHSRDERINDYVDGLLGDDEARAFERDMARDDTLRTEVDSLRALLAAAEELPMSVAPRRDLWPDISTRLVERDPVSKPKGGWSPVARGIAAVAAAVLIFVAGMWYAQVRWGGKGANTATVVEPTPGNGVELAGYQQVENQYAAIRATLRAELEKARPSLAPETVRVIDDSLAVIDKAISDIETALASDPGNDALIRSLVAVYNQEVGMLEQVTRLAAEPAENNA